MHGAGKATPCNAATGLPPVPRPLEVTQPLKLPHTPARSRPHRPTRCPPGRLHGSHTPPSLAPTTPPSARPGGHPQARIGQPRITQRLPTGTPQTSNPPPPATAGTRKAHHPRRRSNAAPKYPPQTSTRRWRTFGERRQRLINPVPGWLSGHGHIPRAGSSPARGSFRQFGPATTRRANRPTVRATLPQARPTAKPVDTAVCAIPARPWGRPPCRPVAAQRPTTVRTSPRISRPVSWQLRQLRQPSSATAPACSGTADSTRCVDRSPGSPRKNPVGRPRAHSSFPSGDGRRPKSGGPHPCAIAPSRAGRPSPQHPRRSLPAPPPAPPASCRRSPAVRAHGKNSAAGPCGLRPPVPDSRPADRRRPGRASCPPCGRPPCRPRGPHPPKAISGGGFGPLHEHRGARSARPVSVPPSRPPAGGAGS